MNSKSRIQISIEYKLVDNSCWESLELTADEYFDLEPDERPELDSIPKYNHALDYLNLESQRVSATKISLIDENMAAKRLIVEKFWNGGKNRLIERTDAGKNPYWETILEVLVSETPPLWEIIRIGREKGIMTPWYHGFIEDKNDGTQKEVLIDVER